MGRGKSRVGEARSAASRGVSREVPLSDSVRTPLAQTVEVFEPDPVGPRVVDVLNEWSDENAGQAKNAREELLKALRSAGVTRLVADYDGGGDEGYVESLSFEPEDAKDPGDLQLLVEELLYALVGDWGDGDGASGTLELDVQSGEATLENNQRVMDVKTTHYKV